jgi:hypothetical protein
VYHLRLPDVSGGGGAVPGKRGDRNSATTFRSAAPTSVYSRLALVARSNSGAFAVLMLFVYFEFSMLFICIFNVCIKSLIDLFSDSVQPGEL